MGFLDAPRLPAVDALMRAVFEHARVIDALTEDLILGSRGSEGSSEPVVVLDAGDALALIAGAAEGARALSPAELDAVEAVASTEPLVWTDAVRDSFLRILRSGSGDRRPAMPWTARACWRS